MLPDDIFVERHAEARAVGNVDPSVIDDRRLYPFLDKL